jgi:histidinol-phosphatase (PHP family)
MNCGSPNDGASAFDDHERGSADLHLHTEFSWDAPYGSMVETCERATQMGFRVVAFTDHADHVEVGGGDFDVSGYLQLISDCRRRFPKLTILSGVELGEPHLFPEWALQVTAQGAFDLVLGSVHSLPLDEGMLDCSLLQPMESIPPSDLMHRYFSEVLRLLEGPVDFSVLAHLEYPKRYRPVGWPPYHSADHREDIQAVLEAAVRRGVVLELNTTRGGDPQRCLCPSPEVISWWRQAGGREVSIGSDAHRALDLGGGLRLACQVLEDAGFEPTQGRLPLWSPVMVGRRA